MTGPSISFILSSRESIFVSVIQQILPPFAQLVTASLSPALIPAFSLRSLGSTIWPRSSTLIIDSTWQQLVPFPELFDKETLFLFPGIGFSVYRCSDYSDYYDNSDFNKMKCICQPIHAGSMQALGFAMLLQLILPYELHCGIMIMSADY